MGPCNQRNNIISLTFKKFPEIAVWTAGCKETEMEIGRSVLLRK